jgi:hypothetical protein
MQDMELSQDTFYFHSGVGCHVEFGFEKYLDKWYMLRAGIIFNEVIEYRK